MRTLRTFLAALAITVFAGVALAQFMSGNSRSNSGSYAGPVSGQTPIPTATTVPTATPTPIPRLLPNGDMEANSGWIAHNTPAFQGRSTEQVHGGTYSWKIVADSANDGIQSSPSYTTIAGHRYEISGWIYADADALTGIALIVQSGDVNYPIAQAIGTVTNEWAFVTATYTDTNGGPNGSIYLRSNAGTFYVDDWTVVDLGP